MTKTTWGILGGVAVLVASAAMLAPAMGTHADTRARDRADRAGVAAPAPEPPSDTGGTTPQKPIPTPGGGITSSTNGVANSGGNKGGHVETGDEHVEVFEVNIGPTNPPQDAEEGGGEEPSAPPSEPQCDGRSRSGCAVGDSGRPR